MIYGTILHIDGDEEYLERCLNSLVNQTFTDFELILVDDGSPDNCGKICDEYTQKDIDKIEKSKIFQNPKSWYKSNPTLGVIKKLDYLMEQVDLAKKRKADRIFVLSKDFNINQNGVESWLNIEDFDYGASYDIEDFRGSYCLAHVDLAETTDLCCAKALVMKSDNKTKYIGTDENWAKAEAAIIEAAEEKGLNTVVEYGEAAFYGPKLDFMVKDALGRSWQLGTIQVDYNLPERFDLTYKGSDDKLHRPIMIHRAPFGSMERFVAVLLEHTAGKFPLWLTPDQVVVLPISEKYNDYAHEVARELSRADVRTQVDDRNEKIGRKIRDNELKRIPYLLIVGEKEAEERKVSVRAQGDGDKGQMTIAEFADFMHDLVAKEIEANK